MVAKHEFSYSSPEQPRLQRTLIRCVETLTGRPKLQRLYFEHRRTARPEDDFFEAAIRKLDLRLDYDPAALAEIPAKGPLVVVANHPYGVLDGLVIACLVGRRRRDFKVLTNALLYKAEEVRPWLLPVDFSETREALETNLKTRAEARRLLAEGGCVVVFPGGTVSTTPRFLGRAEDPEWGPFTAELILRARATVVPVFFEGQNSRLFQIASHVSYTLRLSLLFKEVVARMGTEMRLAIGRPLAFAELAHLRDKRSLVRTLRALTYRLGEERFGKPAIRVPRRKRLAA